MLCFNKKVLKIAKRWIATADPHLVVEAVA